jgi:hypothetical protein
MTNPHSSGGVALEAKSSHSEARGAPGALVLDLLDWLAREPRTHRETIETWGSHCPRITPWEDAQEAGLVQVTRNRATDGPPSVVLTRWGRAALEEARATRPGRAAPVDRPFMPRDEARERRPLARGSSSSTPRQPIGREAGSSPGTGDGPRPP